MAANLVIPGNRAKRTALAQPKAKPSRVEAKAERTRAAILDAAEQHFARRGFASTRLDDIAEQLGMTGAALFYYFRDKGSLYDAMMERAFGSLTARLMEVLATPASIGERVDRAVEAWVDSIVARPALARLMLRHIADADEHPTQRVYPTSDALMSVMWPLFNEGKKTGEFNPIHDHPYHAASAIIGSTIFYASALAPLVPAAGDFNPLSPEQVAAHKRDALRISRFYLGMKKKRKGSRAEGRGRG